MVKNTLNSLLPLLVLTGTFFGPSLVTELIDRESLRNSLREEYNAGRLNTKPNMFNVYRLREKIPIEKRHKFYLLT